MHDNSMHGLCKQTITTTACLIRRHSPGGGKVALSLQAIETSSLWLQSLIPQPLCRHLSMLFSDPVH